ncbi:hypothetical protein LA303_00170 [Candidatus Sulfidibacterium hydrothermale]|uniref:hypothetical protein n=1 Tax=Candidatus Sulfidibacterium hydrothermale TaxID=2875962 RepID=UPI001F0AFE51|nr:hypothetical protein [Candidatus Sulfidibacterium hydrothermale]UBM62414.1 hypothetical protein LA303_00170 [Candidatus Sulfidibacterium hydrothermale]
MMKLKNKLLILPVLILFLGIPQKSQAQYTTKRVRSKYEAYTDSLKNVKYNYVFPFLGQGAYKKGFDIQYPIGFMLNYFYGEQGITIDNFRLGYENAYGGPVDFPLTPTSDSLISFGDSRNTTYSFNIRPDIWVFPFLDVYGIFGYGNSKTDVAVNLLPYSDNSISFNSVVDQDVSTYGFGMLFAGGIGPVWVSVDANMTWNKPALLDKPTVVNIVGIRMGKVFTFKNRPYSNISVWVGAMYLTMQSETVGAIKLQDALPQDVWDRKDEIVGNYWDWYHNEATPLQQALADKTITPLMDALDKREGESVVKYGMDKQTKEHWNLLIGMQYQINKHWQIRSEGGIIGDRKSILVSLNYRMLGFKKKPKGF